MPRKRRKQVRLGRLRKTVSRVNSIYGLMVQAFDALRGEHVELQARVSELERRAGMKWDKRRGVYA